MRSDDVILIVIVSSVVVGLSDACCPSFWTEFGGSCYRYVTHDKYWQEAEAECNKLSPSGKLAHLVSIDSAQENSFVHALFREEGGAKHDAYWIGANDIFSEGLFEWSDGTPVSYTRWRGGEPSGGDEDCVEVYESDAGWNDKGCKNGRPYVCEVEMPTTLSSRH